LDSELREILHCFPQRREAALYFAMNAKT